MADNEEDLPEFPPLEIPEARSDLRALAIQSMQQREKNAQMIAAIQRTTGVGVDVADAKLDYVLGALVHVGAISVADRIEIDNAWERQLTEQLTRMMEDIRQQLAQQQSRARLGVAPNGADKLILPGGRLHSVPPRPNGKE